MGKLHMRAPRETDGTRSSAASADVCNIPNGRVGRLADNVGA